MYCPSCGKNIAEGSAFCMYCGKATGLNTDNAPTNPVTTMATTELACPRCHQLDAVRHLHSILAEGVSVQEATTRSSSYGMGGTIARHPGGQFSYAVSGQVASGVSHSEGKSMSMLAARLIELFDGLQNHNISLMKPKPVSPSSSGYGMNEVPKFNTWYAELRFRDWLLSLAFYPKWDSLHYCTRCAGVFVPGLEELVPLSGLEEFLYEYPSTAKQEYCQIEAVVWFAGGFFASNNQPRKLIALGYGPNGIYTIKDRYWIGSRKEECVGFFAAPVAQTKVRVSMMLGRSPCTLCQSNYDQFVTDLRTEGWQEFQPIGEGDTWCELRMVRPIKS